jgi:hypothetical protein
MTKTVFVIGAGAGYDFDMPLGADLVRDIAELLKGVTPESIQENEGEFWKCIRKQFDHLDDVVGKDVVDAVMHLSRAIHFAKSIDTLINDAKNDAVKAVGKIAISYVIAKAEGRVPFLFSENDRTTRAYLQGNDRSGNQLHLDPFAPRTEIDTFEKVAFRRILKNGEHLEMSFGETWFTSFFRELRSGLTEEQFIKRLSETTIINFNYDRLLEYFLLLAIRQYDGVPFGTAQKWLKHMKHIHPYGVLGSHPIFVDNHHIMGGGIGGLPSAIIAKAPNMIRTFDEGVKTEDRNTIAAAMAHPERVVLLGYGFHRQNNKLLGLDIAKGKGQFWGTAVNVSEAKRSFISKQIMSDVGVRRKTGSIRLEPMNCRELIDEFGDDFFPVDY